ncbi:unnamed protein product [Mytilus edulis]|uniref:Endonuclease/exonuclease/phosphatase domain-containing protein n=1 Tax=Mytilus edulis TaxID=6550 RepID=A0A8S3PS56_MYTED|nr:unnamed protein product [Mytilus edulis]
MQLCGVFNTSSEVLDDIPEVLHGQQIDIREAQKEDPIIRCWLTHVSKVGISESHLRDKQTIDLNGYKWIGNNRKTISPNAWRGSGGVGFLIKNNVFNNFDVNILDRNRDDILWIYLQCKYDQDVKFYFCVCYLQPERSCRGNIAQEFYDSLLSQIYLYSTGVPIFLCGDFNGRSGLQQDFDDTLDMVLPRQPIDETKNAFGDYLPDFLRDAK